MSEAIKADVRWTFDARQQLQCYLSRLEPHQRETRAVAEVIASLGEPLRDMLGRDGYDRITVLSQFSGFRPQAGQYILLVEAVDKRGGMGRWIAKLVVSSDSAQSLELRKELLAEGRNWRTVVGHSDPVLLPVRLLPADADDPGKVEGLLYEDAGLFIGGDVVALETAFVSSVMFAVPLPSSIRQTLKDMYDRLGFVLYRSAGTENLGRIDFGLEIKNFDKAKERWNEDGVPRRTRRDVNSVVRRGKGLFRDPLDALTFVVGHLGGKLHPRELLVPVMLRGAAHGDLHGRNVRVGLWNNEARFPAVYDYEDMRLGNYVGLDFVKMETELKIRIYPLLFPTTDRAKFLADVQDFEIALAERCEKPEWPAVSDEPSVSRKDRLAALLLAIRRMASVHLNANKQRQGNWLPEYYFLLAVYGVLTGRFNTHGDELGGAYVSAGVAMARYLWDRESRLSATAESAPPDDRPDAPPAYPTHDEPLRQARQLVAANNLDKADDILAKLAEMYPHVLEVVSEQAHVLLCRGEHGKANTLLREALERFELRDPEFYSRLGAIAKKEAIRLSDVPGREKDALRMFDEAYLWYEQGYAVTKDHYPGVNLATVLLLTAALRRRTGTETPFQLREMRQVAEEILSRRREWNTSREDNVKVWLSATEGELRYLLGDFAAGTREYAAALAKAEPGQKASIIPQAKKLLQALRALGEPVPEADIHEAFRETKRSPWWWPFAPRG